MGVDTRRPPLPLPTESWADNSSAIAPTEVATDVSRRTDRTSYSIPEDGSPITISTKKHQPDKSGRGSHSQTSLLIEYYEDKPHSKPSVRVKVTPSSKKLKNSDSVKITQIGADSKPSYSRRISLGSRNEPQATGGTEVSQSSSNPPIEIEVLKGSSDLSSLSNSQSRLAPMASDISSMPADSMLEGPVGFKSPEKRLSQGREKGQPEEPALNNLKPPSRRRSRSLSRERIAHKVIEKLTSDRRPESSEAYKAKTTSGKSRSRDISEEDVKPRSRRSSKQYVESDLRSGTESSLRARDYDSNVSGASRSSVTNPKVIQAVEDAIRRLILPEIESIKRQQSLRYERAVRDSYASESTHSRTDRDRSKSSTSIQNKAPNTLRREESESALVSGESTADKKHHRSSGEVGTDQIATARSASREERHRDRERRRKDGSRSSRDEVAGGVGSGLTAAALESHEKAERRASREHRRKRSKTSSRSNSIAATDDDHRSRNVVPPLPLTSELVDSELTRESILSAETVESEPHMSQDSDPLRTPIRSVSRGQPQAVLLQEYSPVTKTPPSVHRQSSRTSDRLVNNSDRSKTPVRERRSPGIESLKSNKSSDKSIRTRARNAGLAAAGLGGAATAAVYVHEKPREISIRSPTVGERVQMDRSRAIEPALRTSAVEYATIQSKAQSPNFGDGRELSEPVTPRQSEAVRDDESDKFYEQQHRVNDQYRNSFEYKSQLGSTTLSDGTHSYDSHQMQRDQASEAQEIRGVGATPGMVGTPVQVESAVASLVEPSTIESEQSNRAATQRFSYQSTSSTDEARDTPREELATIREHGLLTEHDNSSRDRWSMLRDHAKALSNDSRERLEAGSPQRNTEQALPSQAQSYLNALHALNGDHHNEEETGSADHSRTPTGRDAEHSAKGGITAEYGQQRDSSTSSVTDISDERFENIPAEGGLLGYGKGVGEAWPRELSGGALSGNHIRPNIDEDGDKFFTDSRGFEGAYTRNNQEVGADPLHRIPSVKSNYEVPETQEHEHFDGRGERYLSEEQETPTPTNVKDEIRSLESTPLSYSKTPRRLFEEVNLTEQQPRPTRGDDYIGVKQPRFRPSDIPESPMYEAATGAGMNHIQSQDVVALMDHLTVRDGQRNARDTEILVTLVRSAAEMRSAFEEMKRFIEAQNKINMQRTDLDSDRVINRILSTPGPQTTPSRAQVRPVHTESDDTSAKKHNIFRRALRGLSSRNQTDLAKLEDMLMQLLDQMDSLREAQTGAGQPSFNARGNSLDSYERLRATSGYGYDADAQGGSSSTPNRSGNFTNPQARQLSRGFENRVTSENKRLGTVFQDDEHTEEHPEGMRTPTQDDYRSPQFESPQQQQPAGRASNQAVDAVSAADKSRKHKSNGSSLWSGIPRLSRWSKTTASSAPENRSPVEAGGQTRDEAFSDASRSGSDVNVLPGASGAYNTASDDRLRSAESLTHDQQNLKNARSPSPLIPETSPSQFEGPKYRANHNSLTLEHPQPRSGSTRRHQTRLEYEADTFGDDDAPAPSPDSDAFGSAPSLARLHGNILGAMQRPNTLQHHATVDHAPASTATSNPSSNYTARNIKSYEPSADIQPQTTPQPAPSSLYNTNLPPHAPELGGGNQQSRDDGPHIPQYYNTTWNANDVDDDDEWEETMMPASRKRSPYIPGGLLAPIEERYSMELDRSSLGYRDSIKSNRSLNASHGREGHQGHRYSMSGEGGKPMADVREEDETEADETPERSLTPTLTPRAAVGAKEEPVRKLTGPREMPGAGAGIGENGNGAAGGPLKGTVRRKPARRST